MLGLFLFLAIPNLGLMFCTVPKEHSCAVTGQWRMAAQEENDPPTSADGSITFDLLQFPGKYRDATYAIVFSSAQGSVRNEAVVIGLHCLDAKTD